METDIIKPTSLPVTVRHLPIPKEITCDGQHGAVWTVPIEELEDSIIEHLADILKARMLEYAKGNRAP